MFLADGIASKNKAKIPPKAVKMERSILKLRTFSARKPASDGVKMNKIGMTALITAVSKILKKVKKVKLLVIHSSNDTL